MFVELVDFIIDFLPIMMFASLAVLLFTGYPVAFILGGLALLFGFTGYLFDMFQIVEFFQFPAAHLGPGGREPGARRGAHIRRHGRDDGAQRCGQ